MGFARHAARRTAVAYFFSTQALFRTYSVAAHAVALAPSHVESLGQGRHALSEMYVPASQPMHSLAPELLYLPLSHCFASVPSQVESLGQSLQEGESKYLVAGHLMVSPSSAKNID